MSEPTNAQMAEQEDMRLDAQIAELYAVYADEEPPPILVEVDREWMASDPVFDVIAKHLGGSK